MPNSDVFTRDKAADIVRALRDAFEVVLRDCPAPILERGLTKDERLKRIREYALISAAAHVAIRGCDLIQEQLYYLPEVLCVMEEKEADPYAQTP